MSTHVTFPGTVVVSNGSNRFHLAVAASELAARGHLSVLVMCGYPTRRFHATARTLGLTRKAAVARFLDRRVPIPENQIERLWAVETMVQLAAFARARGALASAEWLIDRAFRLYGHQASGRLRRRRDSPAIYHYRSGFGLASVAPMKARGAVALCDHSIAHPLSLMELLGEPKMPGRWRTVLHDLDQADHVLVNSDFVKSTFLEHGWDERRVHVLYLGVDDAFLDAVPHRSRVVSSRPLRLLFAGSLEHRKGSADLEQALSSIDDIEWTLDVAGPVPSESRVRHRALLDDPRVRTHGTISRAALARTMTDVDVFVFPSRAEGSARVVFEALAAGLYVVTTRTAGSIVQHGVHGALVESGDPLALADEIRRAAADPVRVSEIGRSNAELVRARYTQRTYGEGLLDLYTRLEGAPRASLSLAGRS